jgi:hypothetical protein
MSHIYADERAHQLHVRWSSRHSGLGQCIDAAVHGHSLAVVIDPSLPATLPPPQAGDVCDDFRFNFEALRAANCPHRRKK